jgi:hypothetical protein
MLGDRGFQWEADDDDNSTCTRIFFIASVGTGRDSQEYHVLFWCGTRLPVFACLLRTGWTDAVAPAGGRAVGSGHLLRRQSGVPGYPCPVRAGVQGVGPLEMGPVDT